MNPSCETIKFEIHLQANYWDQPPHAKILVDTTEYFNDVVPHGEHIIQFMHTCEFNNPHRLTLIRTGKNHDQCVTNSDGTRLDQILTLTKLKVDGIDIRNIVWSKSINIADYPEPWASEQRAAGNMLEEEAIGVTMFGHNGTWYLDFTSPFYIFVMRWMGKGFR